MSKKITSCIITFIALILIFLMFSVNTFTVFAATVTMEENSYEQISGSRRDEYKNRLFFADSYTDSSTNYTLNYRYYTPSDMSEAVPLVIELHGRGERGSDNDSQLNNAFVRPFIENENSKFYGAMVIVPQCPVKEYNNGWVNLFDNQDDANSLNYNNYSVDEIEESDECRAIVSLIESTCQNYNIDRNRIYIIGISQGAVATYDLLARHGDMFAAAVPIAGIGDVSKADIYANIPIYAFHGNADTTVPYENAKVLYDAIQAQDKGLFNLVTYEGGPHAIWESAIVFPGTDTMPALEDWLFSQSKRIEEQSSGCFGSVDAILAVSIALVGIGAFVFIKKAVLK